MVFPVVGNSKFLIQKVSKNETKGSLLGLSNLQVEDPSGWLLNFFFSLYPYSVAQACFVSLMWRFILRVNFGMIPFPCTPVKSISSFWFVIIFTLYFLLGHR